MVGEYECHILKKALIFFSVANPVSFDFGGRMLLSHWGVYNMVGGLGECQHLSGPPGHRLSSVKPLSQAVDL